MEKILGFDLGTNSIGWALRDLEKNNQIVDHGVVLFETGVGFGKNGEYSRAAERRGYRGKRRLYNAKRYRKWALLKVLIENEMCPTRKDGGLSMDELRLWSIGEWSEENGKKTNKGRKYPVNEEFLSWLRMDEKYFGKKGVSEKENIIRKSPYDLRCELLEGFIQNEKERKFKLGRALYHLCQRRGFKSNTKGSKSTFKPDESYAAAIKENKQVTPALVWNKDLAEKNIRIRGRGKIDREEFVKEFKALCESQNIEVKLSEDLYKAIYTVRPLRSQKGLVGKCTLEKGKTRIPISHPMFEEFRALQFINNIKKRIAGSSESYEKITIEEKRKIFSDLFFRKSKPNFKFEEITERFSEKGKYEFNYDRKNPSVSACPFITGLMDVFGDDWKDKFIKKDNWFGINWSGLSISYNVAYGKNKGKKRILKIDYAKNNDSLWHLLFDFVQTKDDDEKLTKFLIDVIGWNPAKAKQFAEIKISQGYGSLSSNAIRKIIPYLQEGNIYSEAVSFANLNEVLGEEMFNIYNDKAKEVITKVIAEIKDQKEKLNIVNGLIQQHYGLFKNNKSQGITAKTNEQALKDIEKRLIGYFNESTWNKFSENKKKEYRGFVTEKYLKFLDGKQEPLEKAAYKEGKPVPSTDYYRLPRLDQAIKAILRKEPFHITEESLNKLYHPSDIDIYPQAVETEIVNKETGEVRKIKQLGQPMPPSKGWKNPMAMRTMHELRTLTNYLLSREDRPERPRIDEETKIVVEVARELNDANYRKAISDWQDDKRDERSKIKEVIIKQLSGYHNITENTINADNYNKFLGAIEQLVEQEMPNDFKEKYKDFIETFLVRKKKKKESTEDKSEIEEEEHTQFDYMMYLILNYEKFTKLLKDQPPGKDKILNLAKDFDKKRKQLQDMITRYKLWKEQKFQCFYTGRLIPLTELFSEKYQIEHTIPRSVSFDSELKNLTICDASYNNYEKDNKFPTECKNYHNTAKCRTNEGEKECTPIKERVNRIIKPKVEELEERIKRLKNTAKNIPDWEVERRNANIRLRHYLEFEYEYWKRKFDTFTIEHKDWKDIMKNSQLVDTQLVSKYSRAYLKSLFNRVDVQKGIITSEFRKILGLPKKVRDNHAHHAVDAMVLTLIPGSATRDSILKIYYELEECKQLVKSRPEKQDRIEILEAELEKELSVFNLPYIREKVKEIKSNVLINHVSKDRTLIPIRKKARKRGKVDFVRDKKTNAIIYEKDSKGNDLYQTTKDGKSILQKDQHGNLIPVRKKKTKYLEGDSVRGALHDQTFLGAIKITDRDEKGNPKKENGKYVTKKNEKGDELIRYVKRIPIEKYEINKTEIVDPILKSRIDFQITEGRSLTELYSDKEKQHRIRHIRVFTDQPIAIKKVEPAFLSKKEYKQSVYAINGSNYILPLYEGVIDKKICRTAGSPITLYEITELKKQEEKITFPETENYFTGRSTKVLRGQLPFKIALKPGMKVILYKESKDELKDLENVDLQKRIYKVTELEKTGSGSQLKLNWCLFSGKIEGNGVSTVDYDDPKPRYRLSIEKWNFIVEGAKGDFKINPDGEIKWLF